MCQGEKAPFMSGEKDRKAIRVQGLEDPVKTGLFSLPPQGWTPAADASWQVRR